MKNFKSMTIIDQEDSWVKKIFLSYFDQPEENTMFMTGTKVYGPFTKNSDIDVVIHPDFEDRLRTILKAGNILIMQNTEHDSYQNPAFYADLGFDKHINFILTETQEDFDAWQYATDEMCKIKSIKNRTERIRIFQLLKGETND